ncbi:MAG TPA: hypothetical protein VJQ26_13120, partial [Ktedonobacteraceae bacterium]|nr:hypothetical protein [Ktedonobacteraceae bacterium]
YMPQFVQVTSLGGRGMPQRRQRCTDGPPYGGYIADIQNLSTKDDNTVDRVLHIFTHMSTT